MGNRSKIIFRAIFSKKTKYFFDFPSRKDLFLMSERTLPLLFVFLF